jgi:uncharacterized protein
VTRKRVWEVGATAALLLAVAVGVGGFFAWRERQRRLNAELVTLLSSPRPLPASAYARMLSLIRQGASVHRSTPIGLTVLIEAAHERNVPLLEEALTRGADPNVATQHGFTALMAAAHVGSVECIQRLLDYGADVNQKDDAGLPALAYAQSGDSPAAVRLLKQHGAKE